MQKILVINGKGGVGKTTSSIEVFSPYLFLKNNFTKVSLYTFDEENFLKSLYEESDVLKISVEKVNNIDMEDGLSSILLQDTPTVIDIGANKTTTYLLKVLEETGLSHTFDMIAIPITDGEQDTLNAEFVYNEIKNMNIDVPIVFILSRYVNGRELTLQFDSFFEQLYPKLDERDKHFIPVTDSDIIKYAKKASKTIYEMSMDKTDYDIKIKIALMEKKHKSEVLAITKKKRVFKMAQEYRLNILDTAFQKIDKASSLAVTNEEEEN